MTKIVLYHGTENKVVARAYGGGNDKHDCGRGFTSPETLNLLKNGLHDLDLDLAVKKVSVA